MHDPIAKFSEWFGEAKANPAIQDPTAMTLATASRTGIPSARIVLLKGFDACGFVFYTNMHSRKSEELKENPHAALCFAWPAIAKQVRVEGAAEQVSDKEADEYYATRPFISRIGAWASEQSQPLVSRDALMEKVEELQARYSKTNPPPRPPHWSGWRIIPRKIEFWQEGPYRLHDREVFTRSGDRWEMTRLNP